MAAASGRGGAPRAPAALSLLRPGGGRGSGGGGGGGAYDLAALARLARRASGRGGRPLTGGDPSAEVDAGVPLPRGLLIAIAALNGLAAPVVTWVRAVDA